MTLAEAANKTFYSVSRDNKWTNEAVPMSFFTDKGATVTESRLHGDLTIWIDGHNVATLFESQAEQIVFLRQKGLV